MTNQESFVRPGEGLEIEQMRLAPIKAQLKAGSYVVEGEAHENVVATLADPTLSANETQTVLNHPRAKGFRNAVTSIMVENIWPKYEELTTGASSSLYALRFDGGASTLDRLPLHATEGRQANAIATMIAASNQDVSTHLICESFSNGRIPSISGDREKDQTYFEAFRNQTDLVTQRTGNFFDTLSAEFDSPTRFIASGLLVLRTHVFGMPNLVDGVAESQGIALTPDQHRTGIDASLRTSVVHYYLPTAPVAIAINSHLIDPRTRELRSEQWTSNYDPNEFVVFPLSAIVRGVNNAAVQQKLPVQTNCPAFHSRVTTESPGDVVPLPRSLAQVTLNQLDALYYPQRQQEHERRPLSVLVTLPDAWTSRAPQFPSGLFVPGRQALNGKTSPEEAPMPQLTDREKAILHGLGAETSTPKEFAIFVARVEASITEALGIDEPPLPQYEELQRFYRRLLVDMDGAFDANRSAFAEAAALDGDAFLDLLGKVPINRLDSVQFTAQEALDIFDKVVADPSLYPPEARTAIQEAAHAFMSLGVAEIGRQDSTNLSGRETQTVKEMTNGMYAGLLFDIVYGVHINAQGYASVRDRFIAAKLAYQYHDEVLDILSDAKEGSANLLNAVAAETNEAAPIEAVRDRLSALLPSEGDAMNDPSTASAYYALLRQTAPRSYTAVWKRQRRLLEIAQLDPIISSAITLPDPA